MKTTKRMIITALWIILINVTQSSAIEGLKLSIHCPDVWLTWPSTEYVETYLVQYRQTLDSNCFWVTLTNYMQPDSGTNLTSFVHSNMVSCPAGQIIGMSSSFAVD